MIVVPFKNDFYSYIIPPNKEEVLEHCWKSKNIEDQSFSWGFKSFSKKENIDPEGFEDVLYPSLDLFLSEIYIDNCDISIESDLVWKNTYYKGYHQEIHSHIPSDFSCVIFLDDYDDNSSQFYFFNENGRNTPFKLKSLCNDNRHYMDDSWAMKPEKGSIIFFPSHMLHGVTPHFSEKPRTTVALNFILNN